MNRRGRGALIAAALTSAASLVGCSGYPTAHIQQPATAPTSGSVPAHGETLAYLKQGRGPAVVIVHGIGGRKEDWQATMGVLARQRTVYAVDMLGFGGSSKTASEITIRTQAEALRALLDAEGVTRAAFIGNSVGGWVTATFASVYPARVEKLVLVDVAGFQAMFERPSTVNFYPNSVDEMRTLLSYVLVSPTRQTPEYAERALAALNASGERQAATAVFSGLFMSQPLEQVMPGIVAPTLVLWGAQDRLLPPALADTVSDGIKGSRKVLIQSAGHFPQLDNPAAFHQAVLDFLR